MKKLRIAIGQISSESNHFRAGLTELPFFRDTGYLHEGSDVLKLADSDTEVGGFIEACARAGDVEIVPLIATRGNSSAPLSDHCYGYLRGQMLDRLRAAGRVDGVLISHHGSMAAASQDDPEGDMAAAIRQLIGPATPLGMTLDMHANVTPRRIRAATIITAYEQYPHDDVRRTGARAAELVLRTAAGEIEPVMAHARLPMLLTAFNAATGGDGPFAVLMHEARRVGALPQVLSTALFLVGSYIDVPEMASSVLVIADGDANLALGHAQSLAQRFWARRAAFDVPACPIAEAVEHGRQIEGGPVLLLDTADTTGGGAAGDSIALVKGLLDAGVTEPCVAMVIDPQVADQCHRTQIGRRLRARIGHTIDPQWGRPLDIEATLVRKIDGAFRYRGGIFGGTTANMGPSAVLQIGAIRLLVMSRPTYDWADEQYAAAGLEPASAKFVGVKNMMNFRRGYGHVMKGFSVVDLPGPTPVDYRRLPYRRVKRPIYPLDHLPAPVVPVVTVGQTRRLAVSRKTR